MDIDLRKVSLGAPAAERDACLNQYFLKSESYKRLSEGKRSVVLGNRGSGKSAIFRMIAAEARLRGAVVLELAPEDYSYELLQDSLVDEGRGAWKKQGAYAAAWKFLIYVCIMKHVASAKGLKRGAAGRIYAYLRDNHANFDVNPIGTLISYMKRLESVKIGRYQAGMKTRELHKLYHLEEIAGLLGDIDEVCARRQVVVLVDELDKGWDASEDAVAFVAGVFQAAVSINQRTPTIRVLISLRKELYDSIPALYEDAQKVRDIIEELTWDEESLFELITLRVRHALDGGTGLSLNDAWNMLFAETLEYRRNKSFNYLVDRTLYRPREIIQLCSEAVSQAIAHGDSPPLNYSVVTRAEHVYSEARLKDISAEYRFQFPGLLGVLETFRGEPYNLSRGDLELHCLSISTGDYKVDAAASAWAEGMEPEAMIGMLWRIGFIRGRAVGGLKARRRSGSEYLGSHQISNLNLLGINGFHVHPMFRAFLALKEKKGT